MEHIRIEMAYDALEDIIERSFSAGMLHYRRMVTPESDKVKQREAKRYLQQLGYAPKLLDELVEHGRIHRHKNGGDKSNCAIYYSICEIQKKLLNIEMKKGKTTQIILKYE